MTIGLRVNPSRVTVDDGNRRRLPGVNVLDAAAADIVRFRARTSRPKTALRGRCRG